MVHGNHPYSDADVPTVRAPLGAAYGRRAHLSSVQVSTVGQAEAEGEARPSEEDVAVTEGAWRLGERGPVCDVASTVASPRTKSAPTRMPRASSAKPQERGPSPRHGAARSSPSTSPPMTPSLHDWLTKRSVMKSARKREVTRKRA